MTLIDTVAASEAGARLGRIVARYSGQLSTGRAGLAGLLDRHAEIEPHGAWLRTGDGAGLLDCGGYGAVIMGARHPIVMEAVLGRSTAGSRRAGVSWERAASALTSVAPAGLDRVHFTRSGAEAVEFALSLAHAHGRRRLVAMVSSHHGDTLGARPESAEGVRRKPVRPRWSDLAWLPYGDGDALAEELAAHPGEVCVIVEPAQAGGGAVVPPPGYLALVGELCREHGGFLIMDESRTGLGRLGEWWGADLAGVVPDVLLTGDALGGGVSPVSAAVAGSAVFPPLGDGAAPVSGGEFGDAAAAVSGGELAAVHGAIAAIKEERLVTRAIELGGVLLPAIEQIARRNCGELVAAVRGQGLLIGVELADAGLAVELVIRLLGHGVVAGYSAIGPVGPAVGPVNDPVNGRLIGAATVRFAPPAVLTDADVHFLLDAFDGATHDLAAGRG